MSEEQAMGASIAKAPIYSMTGYASIRFDGIECASFTMTLKSVNHRHLDLQLRLPQNFDSLELQLRRQFKEWIHRGHVEFSLQIDRQSRAEIGFNDEHIASYIRSFRALAQTHGLSGEPDLNDVLRLPGMMSAQQSITRDEPATVEAALAAGLPELIEKFNAFRQTEGNILAGELRASMHRLGSLANQASGLREGVRAASFDRLRSRLAELTDGIGLNHERLLAEAALLADRSDIEEELVRLQAHVAAFVALLDQGGPVGKRFDFLLQELNREANTLLSKTGGASSQNGLRITDLGLEMKFEIERAREQVQNLE